MTDKERKVSLARKIERIRMLQEIVDIQDKKIEKLNQEILYLQTELKLAKGEI